MIKVLMIGNHPSNKGGMTSVISQIMGFDWESKGVQLSFIPTYIPGNPIKKIIFFCISYIKILFMMSFHRPNIVHIHMSYKGSFTRARIIHSLCNIFGVKDIVHLHGSEFKKWYVESNENKKREIKNLLRDCSKFIVLGNRWLSTVKQIEPKTKIVVVSNGVDIPNATVKWNDKVINVLYLGVLIPRKGVTDLLTAVKDLKDKHLLNRVHFNIAGIGEEYEKLKNIVKEQNIEDKVTFLGWISGEEKIEVIKNSQILVSPSYNEGLPVSILEGISYGMPVVSTDVGDIPSVVIEGINGYLFTPGDIDSLENAIVALTDENNFNKMSLASRKIALEKIAIEHFYIGILNIYKSMSVEE